MLNDTIIIKAERPAYGGVVIGRLEGKVVMVSGAAMGETVEARIDEEKKDYTTATVTKVIEASPDRTTPPCPYFGPCGGCQLQYLTYEGQVRLKEEVLRDSLRRLGGLEVVLGEAVVGEPWGYRRRGQFKVKGGKVGFFGARSHNVVDIEKCPLMADEVNGAYTAARGLLKGSGASELHVTCGDRPLALIEAPTGAWGDWAAIAKSLTACGFAGVMVEQERKRPLKFGAGYTKLDLDGLKYTLSANSFIQSNWRLNQQVVKLLVEGLSPLGGKSVLDLYSGAGNFALPLARSAGRVIAVEENPGAVDDGKRNAKLNGISNIRFIRSGVDALKPGGPVDIIVADPPRTGLSKVAVDMILALAPEMVACVSCNPATLARDLKRLGERYEVESVRMVDFFPQTYHIEALAILRAKP